MKSILYIVLLSVSSLNLRAQDAVRWSSTTGDVPLTASATAATVQQIATNGIQAALDYATVYCSVVCNVTMAINGAAATATAGTIQPLAPYVANAVIPLTFWTASNVGAGTAQGGIFHVPAGGTVSFCFNPLCGAAGQTILSPALGTGSNYTVSIASLTGTVNITFFGRSYR